MTPLNAMKQSLEALRDLCDDQREQFDELAYPLRTAIAEMESAEPVAWTTMPDAYDWEFVSGAKDPSGKLTGKWSPLFTHPAQSRDSIIEECAAVCEEVHSRYPTDIFPEGQSVTAQSAKMARITANNCALEIRALKGK